MAGFFKKLLGKKDEKTTPQDDGGSWTEHEVSVEVQSSEETEAVIEKPQLLPEAEVHSMDVDAAITQKSDTQPIETQPLEAHNEEPLVGKAPDLDSKLAKTGETLEVPAVEIATLDTADLKFAMDQVEAPKEIDPLDEITAQIQSEIAAERSAKEKKATLEKLIEVTNQLKRPEFDEDFDV